MIGRGCSGGRERHSGVFGDIGIQVMTFSQPVIINVSIKLNDVMARSAPSRGIVKANANVACGLVTILSRPNVTWPGFGSA